MVCWKNNARDVCSGALRGFVCRINKRAGAAETFSVLVQILGLSEAIGEIKVSPIKQFLKKKLKK